MTTSKKPFKVADFSCSPEVPLSFFSMTEFNKYRRDKKNAYLDLDKELPSLSSHVKKSLEFLDELAQRAKTHFEREDATSS